MGFFKLGKRDVIDLSKSYKKQQEKMAEMRKEQNPQESSFNFLGNLASGASSQTSSSEDYVDISNSEERKKKLAKRFVELTGRIEDLSNQIYHLQQRIELLERKAGIKTLG